MPTHRALRLAQEQGLNLVEVAPNSRPPVCRVLDYGKYKYDQKQEAKRRKKNQVVIEVKEVKFRPKVNQHDYDFKVRHVIRFLTQGDKVKCTIMFRGREMAHTEQGAIILQRVLENLGGKVNVEQSPRLEGRNMTMLISPKPGAWPKKVKEPEEGKDGKDGKDAKKSAPPEAAKAAESAEAAEDASGSASPEPGGDTRKDTEEHAPGP